MIGGTIAMHVYKGDVSIGFLAAIVAASNAGGAGSVLGDTTTTMMWIDGVSPLVLTHALLFEVLFELLHVVAFDPKNVESFQQVDLGRMGMRGNAILELKHIDRPCSLQLEPVAFEPNSSPK